MGISRASVALTVTFLSACGGSSTSDPGGGGTGATGGVGTGATGGASGGAGGLGATGGESGTGSGGSGGIGGGTGGAPGNAQPPPPDPNAPNASGTTPTTLAISRVLLGETDWNGDFDAAVWKTFGYDIDGEFSTKTSTFHCVGKPGTPKSKIQTDGDEGIDNSFGSNLIPIFQNLAANPSDSASASYYAGEVGILFQLQNLGSDPSQNAVVTRVYGAAPTSPPAWNGNDSRPVTYESVTAGNLNQPKLVFPNAYVSGNVWVSGAPPSTATLDLPLPMQGMPLTLRLHHVTITAELSPNGDVTHGIISGVLDTNELIAEFKKVAGSFDPGLCDGPTFDSIAQQVAAASDILKNGTQNPSVECDGISAGFGFEGKLVQLGTVAPPAPPPLDPCN